MSLERYISIFFPTKLIKLQQLTLSFFNRLNHSNSDHERPLLFFYLNISKNDEKGYFCGVKKRAPQPITVKIMAKKKQKAESTGFENVEQTLTRTEQFIEDNYRQLLYGLAVIVVIVAGLWLVRMRINNRAEEALAQMYVAEDYFAKDSVNLALYGDGNYLGFIDIADDFKSTKPGNLANYYAAICFMELGQFEDAIDYFDRFDKKDEAISPVALGATGDAYVELGDTKKGIEFYLKAINYSENEFYNPIYLLKAGQIYELEGNFEKALEMYQRIKDDYPQSSEGNNIEKYIARVSR